MMRLPLFRPDELSAAQKPVYEASKRTAEANASAGFETKQEDGAFLGPWSVLLNFPDIATGFGEFVGPIEGMRGITDRARQVVILTVGGHFNAAYELYAHSAMAAQAGLSVQQIAALAGGGRPSDLTEEELVAFDVTAALIRGGVLPAPIYDAAISTVGQDALDTIVFVTIHYLAICTMLNAYDVGPGKPTNWSAGPR